MGLQSVQCFIHGVPLALIAVALSSSCSSEQTEQPTSLTISAGGAAITVDSAAATLVAGRVGDASHLLALLPLAAADTDPAAAPAVGLAARSSSAKVQMSFGAYKFTETNDKKWSGATSLRNLRKTKDGAEVEVVFEDGEVTAKIAQAGQSGVGLDLVAPAGANRVSVAWKCHPGEHFIGLGGQSFDVDHRGQSVRLWVSEDGLSKHADNKHHPDWTLKGNRHTTHTPMPIAISSRGYAFAVDTTALVDFHLCSERDDMVRVEVWEGALKLRFFAGQTPREVVTALTAWTGRPKVPAPFAFGLWLDALYGSENVRRVAKKLRDVKSLAVAIWSEDWRGGDKGGSAYTLHEDWNVDKALYPDFAKVDSDLEALGFKWLTYNNTFVTATADIYEEATSKGFTIKTSDGSPYLFKMHKLEDASLLDFTNPDAVSWAKGVYQAGLDIGADGWMADFCEWLPPDAVLHDKSDPMLHHNLYPVLYQKLNRELFDAQKSKDGKDRAFFVRAAWLGSQEHVDVVWAGDQQTDWSEGDGMRSVIPMGLGLGVTGFPYYGHDIGGYSDVFAESGTTRELFFRWVTLGALSPVMRTHHGRAAAANWHWEKDPESTAHIARWGRLHGRLFPLLWRAAHDAHETGLPMMRPLALDFPSFELGWTSTDQYSLAGLIVAPVVDKGVTARSVTLPAGTYWPLLGGAALKSDGKTAVEVKAAITEIPVFAPAGTVIVLLPDSLQTLSDVYGKGIIGRKEVADDREIWLYRGGDGSFAEVGGKLRYTWTAAALAEKTAKASWNGKAIEADATGAWSVTGNGTLEAGGATLVVEGGGNDRQLVIRLR